MTADTYVNMAVRAPLDEAVGVLEVAGIPGYVGPQAGEWCGVFVDDEDGLVGEDQRPLSAVAVRLSDRTDSTVLMVNLFENRVLGYDLFDHGKAVGYYVSRPGEWTGEDLPSEGGDAELLARMCGLPGVAAEVAELLERDAEDEELFRHARLSKTLALPPYLVGTAIGDIADDERFVVLEPREVPRKDVSKALPILAVALLCFAVVAWARAVLDASWVSAVFGLVAFAAAVLAGWMALAGRRRED